MRNESRDGAQLSSKCPCSARNSATKAKCTSSSLPSVQTEGKGERESACRLNSIKLFTVTEVNMCDDGGGKLWTNVSAAAKLYLPPALTHTYWRMRCTPGSNQTNVADWMKKRRREDGRTVISALVSSAYCWCL